MRTFQKIRMVAAGILLTGCVQLPTQMVTTTALIDATGPNNGHFHAETSVNGLLDTVRIRQSAAVSADGSSTGTQLVSRDESNLAHVADTGIGTWGAVSGLGVGATAGGLVAGPAGAVVGGLGGGLVGAAVPAIITK